MFVASLNVVFYCRSKAMLVKQKSKVKINLLCVEAVGPQVSLLGSVSLSLAGSLQVSFPVVSALPVAIA